MLYKKHSTLGKLIQPCILSATKHVLEPQAAKRLEHMPLSNNTVH